MEVSPKVGVVGMTEVEAKEEEEEEEEYSVAF